MNWESDLQEVFELAGRVDEVRQAAVNLSVVGGGGALHEQPGAVVLRREWDRCSEWEGGRRRGALIGCLLCAHLQVPLQRGDVLAAHLRVVQRHLGGQQSSVRVGGGGNSNPHAATPPEGPPPRGTRTLGKHPGGRGVGAGGRTVSEEEEAAGDRLQG